MVDNFGSFAQLVAKSFQKLTKDEGTTVFVMDVSGDALYETYLASFPEGTNPIYKQRTEHDCSCCRSFIRRVGNVGVLKDGVVRTIWDEAAERAKAPYNQVAAALRDAVRDLRIQDRFLVSKKEGSFGAEVTRSMDDDGNAQTWHHFFTGPIPSHLQHSLPDSVKGQHRTSVQVFERGLVELKPDAVDTVLSLIDGNNLYRGAEHRTAVVEFRKAQNAYLDLDQGHDRFLWAYASGPAARFRNTVIGTLVQDLSQGVEIDRAVAAFESKVAPQNYKRTTAVITPGMVKTAMATIQELGLESALERRFARLEDISVNDVLWVDSAARPLMKDSIADTLMQHAAKMNPPNVTSAEDITIDDFIYRILPEATIIEVLFKGAHLNNLMSLTAPVHPEPKQLFKWDNDFAWSYGGNVADSIKEKVKKAGGNVTNAVLRVSLSWFNYDDLDLHVMEPNGTHIYYAARHGKLDVDMNVTPTTREPVENVSWLRVDDGSYRVWVNSFNKRDSEDVGFVVEMEVEGKLTHFSYNKAVRDREDVQVISFRVSRGRVEKVETGPGIVSAGISQEKWGLHTETFVKVNAITLSPNYWGGNAVGNKHTFFVLDGAKNDEPTRGIYNEFLHSRLETHRKVFEVIGDKTKCQPTEGQLSGLGFSSTKKDIVTVRVQQGVKQRMFNVTFGS
jgi:hypothetical protein